MAQSSTTVRRSLVVGTLGLLGVSFAFFVGAYAGAALNGQTHSVTVARIPVTSLMPASLQK